jgi:glycosyltransferase involved in cell wall biosynthesis
LKVAVISTALGPGNIFTTPPLFYGGLEEVAALRARHLLEQGHRVYLFAAQGSEGAYRARWQGSPVPEFIEEPTEVDFLKHRDVLDDVDFIIDDGWAAAVAQAYPQKSIKVWHGSQSPLMYALAGKVRQFGVSRAHADLIARLTGDSSVGYIYNAVDTSEYPLVREKEDYLLYMNRIDRDKGAHVFVRLCAELGVRCYMIGEDLLVNDQGYVHWIMQHLPHNVEYLGRVSDKVKLDLLGHARAVVAPLSPLYFEVFGLYSVESALMGTQLIAMRNGALPEVAPCAKFADSYEELFSLASQALREEPPRPEDCREKALRWDYRKVWENLAGLRPVQPLGQHVDKREDS